METAQFAARKSGRRKHLRGPNWPFVWCLVATSLAIGSPVHAEDRNNFGGIGLIETPSARMAPDGELSASVSFLENNQHYNLGFQILPWLETSFRYSGLQHFDPGYKVYFDRSFALKARLWDETTYMPALAVGVDDIVGTGIYGGEYLVASKQMGPFDTSLGMGWGRLASTNLFRNPLTLLSSSFGNRASTNAPGATAFGQLFRGPKSGLFGGVSWATPVNGLTLIGEYSSDEYVAEKASGNFSPRSQFNVAAEYQVSDSVSAGLSYLYGRSVGGHISFHLDPRANIFESRLGPKMPPFHIRTSDEQRHAINVWTGQPTVSTIPAGLVIARKNNMVDALWRSGSYSDAQIVGHQLVLIVDVPASAARCQEAARAMASYAGGINEIVIHSSLHKGGVRCAMKGQALSAGQAAPAGPAGTAARAIRADLAKQAITVRALSLRGSEIILYYTNNRYFSESDAIDRISRVLMADAPPDIEKFRLISTQEVAQKEFDVLRTPAERALDADSDTSLLDPHAGMLVDAPLDNPVLAIADRRTFPSFSWSIYPQMREALFDPNRPLGVQFLVGVSGDLELFHGFSLNANLESSVYDNFDATRVSDSALPHVRSDFLRFFSEGKNGISSLDAEYRFRLGPNVFAVAKVGYLESMYAGAGGEILWRPQNERWAVGVDAYDVQERNFDRLFGLQSYHVLTGHVNLYYQSPWYDLNFSVRAGRYLAYDRGLTFAVSRRFPTGIEIGAFMTRTNVPASQFGEGSFDKGISIRIPLEALFPLQTQNQINMDLRPVQRDGGQALANDATLYEETRRTSFGEIGLSRGWFGDP